MSQQSKSQDEKTKELQEIQSKRYREKLDAIRSEKIDWAQYQDSKEKQ